MINKYDLFSKDSKLSWEGDYIPGVTKNVNLPSVSIVIPIYNAANFLEKTIRSLLCNDLDGVELILMDGGSTDHTMHIVDHYREIFSHIESSKDKGQSDAINKGFDIASGKIFYWLNGDDIILPNTLSKVREYFFANKNCNVLVGNAYMTEIDFSVINHFVFSEEKLTFNFLSDYAKNHLIQPSVFFTREAWKSYGQLDIKNHYSMDADLFIALSKRYKFHHLDIDIAYSVYHQDCKTRGARAESIISLAQVQSKYGAFEEAEKTLQILVGMYKELESKINASQTLITETKLNILESQVQTMQELNIQKQKLLINKDLEVNV